jgi:hypothetical protein
MLRRRLRGPCDESDSPLIIKPVYTPELSVRVHAKTFGVFENLVTRVGETRKSGSRTVVNATMRMLRVCCEASKKTSCSGMRYQSQCLID